MSPVRIRGVADADAPRSPEELQRFFGGLGFTVAHHAVMPGMDSPMAAFWTAYTGVEDVLELMGGRGSGKTRGLSLVETALAQFFPRYMVSHIGASKGQGMRCYGYVREYTGPNGVLRPKVVKTTLGQTLWKHGSSIEVLAGTIGGVSGGHPHLMCIDEFDLLDYAVFQQAIGMPMSTGGYDSQIVLASALYRTEGTMMTVSRGDNPPKMMRWTVIDSMEPCDGFKGRPTCEDAIAVRAGKPLAVPPICPLWEWCQGRAQEATGHKKRKDVIRELELTDEFTWRTQYMSEDAKRAGVVYPDFAPEPSLDGSTNVTELAEYDPKLDVYWGADDGYEDEAVILLCQRTPDGGINVFDEVYLSHMTHERMIDTVHQPGGIDGKGRETWFRNVRGEIPRGPYKKPRRVYPDPSAVQLHMEYAKRLGSGARVKSRGSRIMDGVQLVRRLVKTNSGRRMLRVHPRCVNLIRELTYWRLEQVTPGVWIDEPEPNEGGTNPDHAADAFRYLCLWLANRFLGPGTA